MHAFRRTLFPLFLILTCPPTVILIWAINTHCDGSVLQFYQLIMQHGFFHTLHLLDPHKDGRVFC